MWFVQLSGEEIDLGLLSTLFRSPELAVVRDDARCCLTSSEFDNASNAEAVRTRAAQLVAWMNAIAKLQSPNFRAVELGGLLLGDRGLWTFTESAQSRIVGYPPTLNISHAAAYSLPLQDTFVRLATEDPRVAKALRIFGSREENWVNLHNVFEVIQSDIGGAMYREGWITKSAAERFSRTADSPATVGDEARHGQQRTQPPPKPMSLAEASDFIRLLLHHWLRSKQAQQQK